MNEIKLLDAVCIESVPLVKIYRASRENYPMNNRGRHHHGLLFPLSGAEIYSFKDRAFRAPPGSVLYIPKGEPYKIELESDESSVICIDFELAREMPLRPISFELGDKGFEAKLRSLFSEALSAWKAESAGRNSALFSTVYAIIAALVAAECHAPPSPHGKKLAAALDYLNEHYTDEDFSVEKLAELSGISRRYFEKLFFAEMGTSPRDYVIEKKLSLARELLLNEKLSVTDVALELGYADVYHFSKLFKQKCKKTPTEYKNEKSY